MLKLGENIIRLRATRDWTQEELAFRADVSLGLVKKYENPKVQNELEPDAKTVAKIASVFEVAIEEILFGKPNSFRDEVYTIYFEKTLKLPTNVKLQLFDQFLFQLRKHRDVEETRVRDKMADYRSIT